MLTKTLQVFELELFPLLKTRNPADLTFRAFTPSGKIGFGIAVPGLETSYRPQFRHFLPVKIPLP